MAKKTTAKPPPLLRPGRIEEGEPRSNPFPFMARILPPPRIRNAGDVIRCLEEEIPKRLTILEALSWAAAGGANGYDYDSGEVIIDLLDLSAALAQCLRSGRMPPIDDMTKFDPRAIAHILYKITGCNDGSAGSEIECLANSLEHALKHREADDGR